MREYCCFGKMFIFQKQFKNDFRHVYPNKEHLLVSKWEDYIKKVTSRFDRKLHHDDLKKMYKHVKMGMASKGKFEDRYIKKTK